MFIVGRATRLFTSAWFDVVTIAVLGLVVSTVVAKQFHLVLLNALCKVLSEASAGCRVNQPRHLIPMHECRKSGTFPNLKGNCIVFFFIFLFITFLTNIRL